MTLNPEYAEVAVALGVLAGLLFVQLLAADVIGIRAKHLPGALVPANHDDILFRASRAVANSNESLGIFIVALLFCLYRGADPVYATWATWLYVGARAVYALCYYLNIQIMRSIVFGFSLLAIAALIVLGFIAG